MVVLPGTRPWPAAACGRRLRGPVLRTVV